MPHSSNRWKLMTEDPVLCTIQDGGHQWPGGGSTFPFLGTKSDNLDTTSALWSFFEAHPLP